jgi:hypothetical protein
MGRYTTVQAFADNNPNMRAVDYAQATGTAEGATSASASRGPLVTEKVDNPYGSTAGAGSGEFHVYRHARAREMARWERIGAEEAEARAEDEFRGQVARNEEEEAKATEKRRRKREREKEAKRRKRNMKLGGVGLGGGDGEGDGGGGGGGGDGEDEFEYTPIAAAEAAPGPGSQGGGDGDSNAAVAGTSSDREDGADDVDDRKPPPEKTLTDDKRGGDGRAPMIPNGAST